MFIVNNFCIDQSFPIFSLLLTLTGLPFSSSIESDDIVNPSSTHNTNIELTSYANSPIALLYLTSTEKQLFDFVKHYVAKLEHEPNLVFQRYISDYEESSLAAYKHWEGTENDTEQKYHKIYTNPIQAFRMIRRFVKDFPKIKDALYGSDDSEILGKLDKLKAKQFPWPMEKDLNESMNNLLILHEVYELDTRELAKGNILNLLTNVTLSATHCFEIAQYAFHNRNQYTLAMEWLEAADSKRDNPTNKNPILDFVDESLLFDLYDKIATEHDSNLASERPKHLMYTYKYKINSEFRLTTIWSTMKEKFRTRGVSDNYATFYDITAFSTLCKGGNLQTEKEKSELYCWYERNVHPFWYINPQKMELHSKEPYIFQVYDFIGNEFIRKLKRKAIPIQERSQVVHNDNKLEKEKESPYSSSRTAMYGWLPEEFDVELERLSKLIGYLTGLIASSPAKDQNDSLQVASYASGGYYDVHVDSLKNSEGYQDFIYGDRLATFMLYLSDVEHGGRTAFTSAGVSTPAVKGSAVFWYDSKRNGQVDYRAWHGGCPVLIGEKWVANKWIYQNINTFQYKCSLNKNE